MGLGMGVGVGVGVGVADVPVDGLSEDSVGSGGGGGSSPLNSSSHISHNSSHGSINRQQVRACVT